MLIDIKKDIIKSQALLLQHASKRIDNKTNEPIKMTLSCCYQLIAKTYGFESWNQLSAKLKQEG